MIKWKKRKICCPPEDALNSAQPGADKDYGCAGLSENLRPVRIGSVNWGWSGETKNARRKELLEPGQVLSVWEWKLYFQGKYYHFYTLSSFYEEALATIFCSFLQIFSMFLLFLHTCFLHTYNPFTSDLLFTQKSNSFVKLWDWFTAKIIGVNEVE